MHSPSVQFLESSRVPLQSRPPFWGGGAMHSRLRQWAHSVLQADHLLHSVHAPSTVGAQHIAHGNTHVQTHTHAGVCMEQSNVPRRAHRALHTISKHPNKCRVKCTGVGHREHREMHKVTHADATPCTNIHTMTQTQGENSTPLPETRNQGASTQPDVPGHRGRDAGQKEKRPAVGSGSVAKVCLTVKCRSADALTPGSSGTLVQGTGNENP